MEQDNFYIPSRTVIEMLDVGWHVPDCFGRLSQIVQVFARGEDKQGKKYICFYTQFENNARLSGSLKEGELLRTVPLTAKYTSHQLDIIERKLRCQKQ